MIDLPNEFIFHPQNPIQDEPEASARYLADLRGYFVDNEQFEAALSIENSLVYKVWTLKWASGSADLVCGFGTLMPGKIGQEYFFTKGHLHERREAAEIYQGLSGTGYILMENEHTGHSSIAPLVPNSIVYVPGYTAHRTINTGTMPLNYIGINVADAGYDYGKIRERNFTNIVIEHNGQAMMIERAQYLASVLKGSSRD
jgi:glucose-6-phosphate isomerase